MGSVGENCSRVCQNRGIYCNPEFQLSNSTKTYEKLGYNCLDLTTNPSYSKKYHPSYVHSSKKCEGFKNVPKQISCHSVPPTDGETVRLCNCLSPGK